LKLKLSGRERAELIDPRRLVSTVALVKQKTVRRGKGEGQQFAVSYNKFEMSK
jgi:hypothetical protein